MGLPDLYAQLDNWLDATNIVTGQEIIAALDRLGYVVLSKETLRLPIGVPGHSGLPAMKQRK